MRPKPADDEPKPADDKPAVEEPRPSGGEEKGGKKHPVSDEGGERASDEVQESKRIRRLPSSQVQNRCCSLAWCVEICDLRSCGTFQLGVAAVAAQDAVMECVADSLSEDYYSVPGFLSFSFSFLRLGTSVSYLGS